MSPHRARTVGALLVGAVLLVSGCNGGDAGGTAAVQAAPPRVDEATAGVIAGRVVLEGTPPPNATLTMSSDPYCMREARGEAVQEHFVVGPDGGLANAFVHLASGLGSYTYDTPAEPVVLGQRGCRYVPHVFGIRVGQPLEIVNDDETLHNVHASPSVNREFNFGQPLKGMRRRQVFDRPEVMVPFTCDVHGWMNAYAGVLDHPYFAVTGADGRFSIRGVPPGTYTLEVWHEKLGTRREQVTLAPSERREVAFTYAAS